MAEAKRKSGGRRVRAPKKVEQPTRLRSEQPNAAPVIVADRIYKSEAVAEFLQVKVQTLAKWRCHRTPGPPFIKCGSVIRYRGIDLLNWLEQKVRSCDGRPLV